MTKTVPIMVQFAIREAVFNPQMWLRKLYDEDKIVTGGFLPPLGNVEFFWVTLETQSLSNDEFDLSATDFGANLQDLFDQGIIGGFNALTITSARGESFATWTSHDPNEEDDGEEEAP